MTDTIHSCSPFCTLPGCVAGREQAEALHLEIKAAFIARFGATDNGWLGMPGSWFTEGYKAGKDTQHATITTQAARIAELESAVAAFLLYDSCDPHDGVVMMLTYDEALKLSKKAMQQGESNV